MKMKAKKDFSSVMLGALSAGEFFECEKNFAKHLIDHGVAVSAEGLPEGSAIEPPVADDPSASTVEPPEGVVIEPLGADDVTASSEKPAKRGAVIKAAASGDVA